MQARRIRYRGRDAWEMDNGALALVMMRGGGHIASVQLKDGPRVNPLWTPVWPSLEPWEYKPRHAARFGSKLLASICGHNLCLGWFGGPSEEEGRAGMGCHGEAPVARWRLLRKRVSRTRITLSCGCRLPVAGMDFTRTLTTERGSNVVRVRETVRNLSRRDVPFTMCEHVTVGPPFLEKGVTLFDMPATKGHTYPWFFEKRGRLRRDAAFRWPRGPGVGGKVVDMRRIGKEYKVSSDFSAQLMDPRQERAWFSAVNPRLGLLLAYVWRRDDFPWVGNWEENYGRKGKPWAGRSLTRGMEFANTPFPAAFRQVVDLGKFHGLPTYRWIPARGRVTVEYAILLWPLPRLPAGRGVRGVASVTPRGKEFAIRLSV